MHTSLLIPGKNCKDSKCFDPCACSAVDLDQLILESKVTEVKLGKDLRDELYHGWTCDVDAEEKIGRLQCYRHHLEEEYRKRLLGGEPCLKCDELQCLYEKVKKLTASCDLALRPDLQVNKDSVDVWISQNPFCVAREKWEYLVYDILCDLQLEVDIIDNAVACDLTLEILREEIPCDILVAIDVVNRACDLELELNKTDKEDCMLELETMRKDKNCNLGLDLFMSRVGCDLSLEHVQALVRCNISLDIQSCVLQNDCCLSIEQQLVASGEDPNILLHTQSGSYPLEILQFKHVPQVETLTKYGVDTTKSSYLANPDGFIDNLNKDYSGEH